MGPEPREATDDDPANPEPRSPRSPRPRPRRLGKKVSPRLKSRILQCRVAVPWLGLRRIARALGLSLHDVRQVIDHAGDLELRRVRKKERCPTCGGLLILVPCAKCSMPERGK